LRSTKIFEAGIQKFIGVDFEFKTYGRVGPSIGFLKKIFA
jgi:hypothetical protein